MNHTQKVAVLRQFISSHLPALSQVNEDMLNGAVEFLDISLPNWEAFASVFVLIAPLLEQFIINTIPQRDEVNVPSPQPTPQPPSEPKQPEPQPNPWDLVLGGNDAN